MSNSKSKKKHIGTPSFDNNSSLTLSRCITYALPTIAMLWIYAPLVIVQGIYAKYYGLSLTTIAALVLFGRFFDAVTDPLIGYFSDRYRRRTGTRKPFVLVGGLLMIVSGYFLYVPFSTGAFYFGSWLFAFYLAYTLFDIPHNAWASDLALTSDDKSIIFSFRSAAVFLGLVLFYMIPLLPFFKTQDITPETLQVSIIAAGFLMILSLIMCMKHTPDGMALPPRDKNFKLEPSSILQRVALLRVGFQSLVRNRPLCLFFGSYIFYGLGYGMWLSLIFLYVDGYLGVGELFAQVFLIAYTVGIVVTPGWCKLATIFGKKTTMSLAMILMVVSFLYTGILRPGEAGLVELLILKIINTLGASCILAMAPAMLSKIVDYSTWRFHSENTATYFSIYAFLNKAGIAAGAALGLSIAGSYGFDATTTMQSSESAIGLWLAMTLLPVICLIVALALTALNPINARRHGVIRRRLDGRFFLRKSVADASENKDQRKNTHLKRKDYAVPQCG